MIPLDRLYVDPNNPRFTTAESAWVNDQTAVNPSVQESVALALDKEYDIASLRMSIEANGFLPLDRVVVRPLMGERYIVLEGNRRVCAAKQVAALEGKGVDLPQSVFESLRQLPCLIYTGTETDASWIFQGIRHIQGIKEWSPYHKARLLVDQMGGEGLTLTQVGRRFGLTAHGAGQWVRGYSAFKQAREDSDYVSEVDDRSYTYFQELFSRSSAALRDWLEWDDSAFRFRQLINLNEFVSWLYPRPGDTPSDDDAEAENTSGAGDWDHRLIRTRDHLRQIAALYREAPDLFQLFRQNRKLDVAYQALQIRRIDEAERAVRGRSDQVFSAIALVISELDNIPHKLITSEETKTRLSEELKKLRDQIDKLELI